MSERERDLDVVIIGAGPAGISAAIWCSDLGLRAVVLEKEAEPGGQLLSIYDPINNYPGLHTQDGREMRDRFMETAARCGADIRLSSEVAALDAEKRVVRTTDGESFSAHSIILATGVRRRRLNIPGETEFAGRGVIRSGARDREFTRGKTVAIVGGGDAALENAAILSEHAAKVIVVHRRAEFSAREEFVKAASNDPRVTFRRDCRAVRINGTDKVESLEIENTRTGLRQVESVDIVLIRIGVEPNSQLLAGEASLDDDGYVIADRLGRTDRSLIFAAGDAVNKTAPTIASAVGDGAAAAKAVTYCESRG